MENIKSVDHIRPGKTANAPGSPALNELQKQYPHLKMSAQSFSGEAAIRSYAMKQSGKYNVAIDPRAISRMGENTAFAGKIHEALGQVKEGDDWLERQITARGSELISCGTIIDKDGNVGGWSISRTSGAVDGEGIFAQGKKSRQELLDELTEKRRERLNEQRKVEEKRRSEKTREESLEANATIGIAGEAIPVSRDNLDITA